MMLAAQNANQGRSRGRMIGPSTVAAIDRSSTGAPIMRHKDIGAIRRWTEAQHLSQVVSAKAAREGSAISYPRSQPGRPL